MCGRITIHENLEDIGRYFEIEELTHLSYEAKFNIAPSQPVLSVVNDGKKNRLGYLRWGLIPSWAKDVKIGYKMINARAETIDEKPAFKQLLSRRRCIVVGSSFYEWKTENNQKQPYCIKLRDEKIISFAGLWDRWQKNDEIIHSCTVITTEANQLMTSIHDRMPVILPKDKTYEWLNPFQTKEQLKSLLKPLPSEQMEAFPVSTKVNSPKNDGPELICPL
ncbi:SOS response-associated peptidase [Litchfieldia alkalitelluris]|uniref:SOS response-associated peptidase n=1 Tax=Litchfieldia alkalitelluris TaxID=304268 RepID=UPI000997E252|nr:SOS response-associated peptidase [Litchfieldia alkalitelluris]